MKDYMVYKDLSLKEASILRIYEMAVCLCNEYVKNVRSGEGTSRDLVHAAWIYRKYIYCLDRAYYFVSQCAFLGSKGNLIPAEKAVKQVFKDILSIAGTNRKTVKSVLKGGWAYQLMDNSIGRAVWNDEFKKSVAKEMYDFTHSADLLDAGYSYFSTRKDARVDDRGQIVVIEFIAYDHDPIITFAIADAMGNLQYQHPIDFATSRPIILNELRDVHFRWHDASEEQAEKYWQVRMTTEEKE